MLEYQLNGAPSTFDTNQHHLQQPENWDYAFDADVWNTTNASRDYDHATIDHDTKNDVSLVDTTFVSNSSASTSSSPHPDPIAGFSGGDDYNMTDYDTPNNDAGPSKPKSKWKKRLTFWKKGRHNSQKGKRSTSLEPMRNTHLLNYRCKELKP